MKRFGVEIWGQSPGGVKRYFSGGLTLFPHFTKELKQIAEQYQVPIILLSQLSSGGHQKENKRSRISYLNELASIAENADIMLILNRDESLHKESNGNSIVKLDIVNDASVLTVKFLYVKEVGGFEVVL
ncbi:DnaB-like helicase C-terminal domain-containing protein [Mesobacillus persicus]|uniref:DnaB-like helicase C-terminal domain-containing protein n=1 Tax=Mesobacillus persicus TaxID=930146 RepID=UPI000B890634